MSTATPARQSFVEEVEIQGHIIDSLLLPKILDEILTQGGTYEIKEIRVGQRQSDPSCARIEVRADLDNELLLALTDTRLWTPDFLNPRPTTRSRGSRTSSPRSTKCR